MKKRVERSKINIDLSEVLISYYNSDGDVQIIKLSSAYSLGDMLVIGLKKNSSVVKRIGEGTDFTLNIMEDSFHWNSDDNIIKSESIFEHMDSGNLESFKSDNILAPVLKDSVISVECTPYQLISNEQFDQYVNIIAKIKGYLE